MLQTGRRQEGVFFASRTLFFKLTTGLGHVLAGAAVDLIGFPTGAKPGEVAQDIVTKLALVEGPLGAVFAICAAFVATGSIASATRRSSAGSRRAPRGARAAGGRDDGARGRA